VRLQQADEGLAPKERCVAAHHEKRLVRVAGKDVLRRLQGVTGAALRLLLAKDHAPIAESGFDLVRAMANHDHHGIRSGGLDRVKDVSEKGYAQGGLQDLRPLAVHPCASACGEDHSLRRNEDHTGIVACASARLENKSGGGSFATS
jgi:hypothetical protein